MDGLKWCPGCEQKLSTGLFYSNAATGWLSSYCKECKRRREREYRAANRAHVNAKQAESQRKHKDKRNAYKKKWRDKNIEKTRAVESAYRERNRVDCNARIKAWKTMNRHMVAEYAMRRNAYQRFAESMYLLKTEDSYEGPDLADFSPVC